MRLRVLASGSSGNGYILYNETTALVIECGCRYVDVLKALDFDRGKIAGALISHEHQDHAGCVGSYLGAAIKCYASAGTWDALGMSREPHVRVLLPKTKVDVGPFRVMGFDTQHDAKEPFGFLIYHPEMGTTLFATDTYYIRYQFAHLAHLMIECNYESGILDENMRNGTTHWKVGRRVRTSHMSLEQCVDTLLANDLSCVNDIVLVHLSHNNSDGELFQRKVSEATGKLVTIARPGVDIDFNKNKIL